MSIAERIPDPEPIRPLVSFLDLGPRQCKFIPGDSTNLDALYCGAPTPDHNAITPYCDEHHQLTHTSRPGGTARVFK